MPPKQLRVVEAERFILKDDTGETRAILGIASENTVCLSLCDRQGKTRVGVSVDQDGVPQLNFFDKSARFGFYKSHPSLT